MGIAIAIVVAFAVLGLVLLYVPKNCRKTTVDRSLSRRNKSFGSARSVEDLFPSQISSGELLILVRELRQRNAQWPEIWSKLNPHHDPTLQHLLLELRNDGMQFAPNDALRKLEIGCEDRELIDAVDVLKAVLGQADLLDRFD